MDTKKVWVFFYGSYINFSVLEEAGLQLENWQKATLQGFDLDIKPRANLVRNPQGMVFGIVGQTSHDHLKTLYTDHAKGVLGEDYLPEAVMVHCDDGSMRSALCYISHDMKPQQAEKPYVERILQPAKRLEFPAWYLRRIGACLTH